MPEPDTGYVAELAEDLYQRYPDLLTAENDCAILRARFAIVVTWIQNPAFCDAARRALAQHLEIPEPR